MKKNSRVSLPLFVPLFILALVSASPAVRAEDDLYSFGGACPSQGAWTRMAIAQTQNILGVIEKLKDNPDCTGIGKLAENFATAQLVLNTSDAASRSAGTNQLESLPTEIGALLNVLRRPGPPNPSAQAALLKRNLQAAATASEASAVSSIPVMSEAEAIRLLYKRGARASQYGLNAAQQVFGALPSYQQCLIGHPNEGMLLLSAAVKMGAAFASSEGGGAHQLGSTLASLVNMMRDQKFTRAMRTGKETEFWLSVSCLLETTTKNYCEAQNNQELLSYARKEYLRSGSQKPVGTVDPNADNPLEGYYLLVRELPLVSRWLRNVRMGTDPRLTPDATFQTQALEKVVEMQKLHKNLLALFEQEKLAMNGLSENAQRNKLIDLVEIMYGMMRNKQNAASEFFTNAVNEPLIPFYLIGLDEIPEKCMPSATVREISAGCWEQWMRTLGPKNSYQPEFNDPMARMEVLNNRLQAMLDGANENAAVFFRQRLVIDLMNLVNQTLVGQNLTVRQALQHMDRFLVRFESRLTDSYSDLAMVGSVHDTRVRIRRILKSFDDLANIGRQLKGKKEDMYNESLLADVENASKHVIDTVIEELKVLLQSDIFLANRFSSFIDRDFAIRIRQGQNMTPYQAQLMKVTQDQLLERITLTFGSNPTVAQNDMAGAYLANNSNLGLIEEVFSDTLYMMLEELDMALKGKGDNATLNRIAKERYRQDFEATRRSSIVGAMGLMTGNPLAEAVSWITTKVKMMRTTDRYYRPDNGNAIPRVESKFGDLAQIRGRICAQTLAFYHRERFIPLCKGAVMKSAFSGDKEHSPLDLTYDDYMSNAAYAEVIRRDPVKTHRRICAMNDYSIRNWVRMLEIRDRQSDKEEPEYDMPLPLPKPAPSVKPTVVEAPVVPSPTTVSPPANSSVSAPDSARNPVRTSGASASTPSATAAAASVDSRMNLGF